MALHNRTRYRAVAVLSWLLLAAGCAASVWLAWPRPQHATSSDGASALTSVSHEVAGDSQEVGTALLNIEEIQVGDRVLAWNPELTEEEHAVADPVADDWMRIELAIVKSDGYRLDITLLRPRTWIAEQQAEVGKSIRLDLPELNQYGDAEVLEIGPCPEILPGPGRVVIGTFRHTSGDTIDIRVKGLDEPIGATQDHPFWSEDRQTFVDAGELRVGEHVKTLSGQITEIESITSRGPPEPVYNLEIHAENVYYVSDIGVLVHNSTPYKSGVGSGGNGSNKGPRINLSHIFHGEINSKGKAVGFHHAGSIGYQGKARISAITAQPNLQGVYRAKVEIFNRATNSWVAKGPASTFFPNAWSRAKVLDEIKGAYANQVQRASHWAANYFEGIAPSGVRVGGYLDKSGNINTAFPIY